MKKSGYSQHNEKTITATKKPGKIYLLQVGLSSAQRNWSAINKSNLAAAETVWVVSIR